MGCSVDSDTDFTDDTDSHFSWSNFFERAPAPEIDLVEPTIVRETVCCGLNTKRPAGAGRCDEL
jgi:hypothetical protein